MKVIKWWATIIVGGLILATGLLLMPLPGPGGTPVALLGLAILSSELPWAKRLLERMKQRLQLARAQSGARTFPGVRMLAVLGGLITLWIVGGIVVWRVWAF
ncbi:MAG: PGPGW domain-containing protein [Candidatus Omnitrophota bacterium]|nr:PGPGW domain-containing protein [Candidatus Omnitrophota bacterium]